MPTTIRCKHRRFYVRLTTAISVCARSPLWADCLAKSEYFFRNCLLPELLGRWYTRSSTPVSQVPETSQVTLAPHHPKAAYQCAKTDTQLFCYCQAPEDHSRDDWIGCNNPNCAFEWFHLGCLNLLRIPKQETWYCPDCHKQLVH